MEGSTVAGCIGPGVDSTGPDDYMGGHASGVQMRQGHACQGQISSNRKSYCGLWKEKKSAVVKVVEMPADEWLAPGPRMTKDEPRCFREDSRRAGREAMKTRDCRR